MRNLSLILVFQLCTLLQLIAQTTTEQSKSSGYHWHTVSVSGNLYPIFPKGTRPFMVEKPIGRFQPSVSVYRDNPEKWIEFNLVALRPNLTEVVIDTGTYYDFIIGKNFLGGTAGTFKTLHAAIGITKGALLKDVLFRRRTILEYSAFAGYRTIQFSNIKEIFPNVRNYKEHMGFLGVSINYGIRLVNRKKLLLDLKLQNFGIVSLEKTIDGRDLALRYGLGAIILVPTCQLRLPLY